MTNLLKSSTYAHFTSLIMEHNIFNANELFAISKSIVHLVVSKLIYAMNTTFKNQVRCPKGNELVEVMANFKN